MWHLGIKYGHVTRSEHHVLISQDEAHVPGQDVDPFITVVGAWFRAALLVGMMIFQACIRSGCRVSGITVRPLTRPGLSRSRGSPSSGAATRSSNGTRSAWESASSSSRVGRRCPISSRDIVLLEIPVEAETPVRGQPGSTPLGAESLEAWSDLLKGGGDPRRRNIVHKAHLTRISQKQQRS